MNIDLIVGCKLTAPLEVRGDVAWYKFYPDKTVDYYCNDRIKKATYIITESEIVMQIEGLGEKRKDICATSESHILLKDETGWEILVRTPL